MAVPGFMKSTNRFPVAFPTAKMSSVDLEAQAATRSRHVTIDIPCRRRRHGSSTASVTKK